MRKKNKLKKVLTEIIGNDPDLDYFADFLEMVKNPKYNMLTDRNGDFYFVLRDRNEPISPKINWWKQKKYRKLTEEENKKLKEAMEKLFKEVK